ncbi:MAG: hypothetical protein R3C05_00590 [Pirellulaceae bacterium]
MTGPKVVVKISSKHSFKGNDLVKPLSSKLGVKGFQFSQSNNNASLTLSYSGTAQSVADAITFGKVDSVDEASRTVTVTIP